MNKNICINIYKKILNFYSSKIAFFAFNIAAHTLDIFDNNSIKLRIDDWKDLGKFILMNQKLNISVICYNFNFYDGKA